MIYEALLEHTSDGDDVPGYDVLIEFLEKCMKTCTPKTPAGIKANLPKLVHLRSLSKLNFFTLSWEINT